MNTEAGRMSRRDFVKLLTSGTLLAGAAVVAQKTGLLGTLFPDNHPATDVPPNYDSKAESQIIQMGTNTVSVTEAQLPDLTRDSIKPVVKGQYPDASIFLPIKLINNQDIQVSTAYHGYLNVMNNKVEQIETGKNLIIPNKGTEIIVPVENAEIFRLHNYKGFGSSPTFVGIVIRFKGPDGTPFEIQINDRGKAGLLPLDILDKAPFIGDDVYATYLTGLNSNPEIKGLPLPIGTPLMKTSVDNEPIYVEFGTLSSKISDVGYTGARFGFDFIISRDAAGNEKVAIFTP